MRTFTLTLFVLLASATSVFAAGTIDITTYYDVPDGDFRNLIVTGAVTLADNNNATVLIAPPPNAGGPTSFGAVAGVRPLTVTANNANVPAVLLKANGNGLAVGALGGVAYGEVSGRDSTGVDAPLYLNLGGGSVSAGAATAAADQLHITAASNNLGLTIGGNTGEVKSVWTTDGFYATYAP